MGEFFRKFWNIGLKLEFFIAFLIKIFENFSGVRGGGLRPPEPPTRRPPDKPLALSKITLHHQTPGPCHVWFRIRWSDTPWRSLVSYVTTRSKMLFSRTLPLGHPRRLGPLDLIISWHGPGVGVIFWTRPKACQGPARSGSGGRFPRTPENVKFFVEKIIEKGKFSTKISKNCAKILEFFIFSDRILEKLKENFKN